MMDLIHSAAAGWLRFNQNGKYAVLLLGALLYLWYGELAGRQARGNGLEKGKNTAVRVFLQYTTLTTVLAAVPATAALLMMYQTKFYDYEWIWSAVPVTAMTAFGMTAAYTDCYEKYWKDKMLKPAAFAALGLAVIALCGNLQGSWYRTGDAASMQEITGEILDELSQSGNTKDMCIWAPREILDSVRALNGDVTLVYGRNMWDESLNAYSYDIYEPDLVKLYEWMENAASLDQSSAAETDACLENVRSCVQTALNYGVNRILIPESVGAEVQSAVKEAAQDMGLTVTQGMSGGYVIYNAES